MKRRFVRAIRSTTWLDASPNERTNERDPHYDHTICCVYSLCSNIVGNFEIRSSILRFFFFPRILKSSSFDASEVRILRVSLNQLLDIQRFLEFSKIFDAPATIVSASLNRGNRFAGQDLFQHLLAWLSNGSRASLKALGSVTELRRTS